MKKTLQQFFKAYKRNVYLLKKLFSSVDKKIVIYTKSHPIYTSIFEDVVFDNYKFIYIRPAMRFSVLEKKALRKAVIIHSDATTLNEVMSYGKLVVVECEGLPTAEMCANEKVAKIYVESRNAANALSPVPGKLKLLYPSVNAMRTKMPATKLKNEPIVLTAVGYGGMVKGFDVVFRIYETLKDKYPLKLVIAGTFGHNYQWYPEITKAAYDKAGFPDIEKKIKDDPNVQMRPVRRHELFDSIYPATDIYLHFSRMETFGYSILEAMSFGLPIVASDFRAIPEMVAHNENGFLVNDFKDDINSEAWFDKSFNEGLSAITRLIEDEPLRRRMGAASLKRIKDLFDLENKKKILQKDYDELLTANRVS